MITKTYSVPNISCGHCVNTIQTEVGELEGIQSVTADAATKVVKITFDTSTDEAAIKNLMAEINYPVVLLF